MFGLVSINAPNVYQYKRPQEDITISPYPSQSMFMQERIDSIRGIKVMSPKGLRASPMSDPNVPSITMGSKDTTNKLVTPNTTSQPPVVATPQQSTQPDVMGGVAPPTPAPGQTPQLDQTMETQTEPQTVISEEGGPIQEGGETPTTTDDIIPTADGGTYIPNENMDDDSILTHEEEQYLSEKLGLFKENPELYHKVVEVFPDLYDFVEQSKFKSVVQVLKKFDAMEYDKNFPPIGV